MNIEKYKAMIEEVTEEPNNMREDWREFFVDVRYLMARELIEELDREVNQSAIIKYGGERQKKKLFEEMAELTQTICHTDDGKDTKWHIAEEIADVRIVLEQMIFLYGIRGEVNRQHRIKMERLCNRLKEIGNDCE